MDNYINNTSLVIALKLPSGDVLLSRRRAGRQLAVVGEPRETARLR